jgi:hypothetical protein
MDLPQSQIEGDIPLPLLTAATSSLTIVLAVFGTLYWAMRPTVITNLGLAVYRPAPGTAIEPDGRRAVSPFERVPFERVVAASVSERDKTASIAGKAAISY